MGNDVDGLVALAVIHTGEFSLVAQLVIHLDLVDRLGGQRLYGRGDILAEKLLAVDENLLNGFALGLQRTVGDGYARHLLQQGLDIGIVGHLEGSGIVANRITLL